jgi:hypothetical protein
MDYLSYTRWLQEHEHLTKSGRTSQTKEARQSYVREAVYRAMTSPREWELRQVREKASLWQEAWTGE